MSDDLSQELRAFEASEALANGDFSACIRGADRIEAQDARIAELEAILGQLLDAQSPTLEVVKRIGRAVLSGGKDE